MVLININGTVSEKLAECQEGLDECQVEEVEVKVKQETTDDLDLQSPDPEEQGRDVDIESCQGHSTIDLSAGSVSTTNDSSEKDSASENVETSNTEKTATQPHETKNTWKTGTVPGKHKRGWSGKGSQSAEYESQHKKAKLGHSEENVLGTIEVISKTEGVEPSVADNDSSQNENSCLVQPAEVGLMPGTSDKIPRVKAATKFTAIKKKGISNVSRDERNANLQGTPEKRIGKKK